LSTITDPRTGAATFCCHVLKAALESQAVQPTIAMDGISTALPVRGIG
jgi:hypothetical protein